MSHAGLWFWLLQAFYKNFVNATFYTTGFLEVVDARLREHDGMGGCAF
jgi:hypothetical protein